MVGRQPNLPPQAPITARLRPENERELRLAACHRCAGLQETINFSFVDVRFEQDIAGNPGPSNSHFEPNECDALVLAGIALLQVLVQFGP
jgi:hypothetical protein